ncbi:hypothetical protein THAOC_12950, partial [Thalassiosira oceanica]
MDPLQEEARRKAAREKKKRQRENATPAANKKRRKANAASMQQARVSLSPQEALDSKLKKNKARRKARDSVSKGDHNDITSQEFKNRESVYQQMCQDAGVHYIVPTTGGTNLELKAHTKTRRGDMTRQCHLFNDVNCAKFKAVEADYGKRCADAGVPYIAPDLEMCAAEERQRDTANRRAAMTRSLTQHNTINDPDFEDEESKFREACSQCCVDYSSPVPVAG